MDGQGAPLDGALFVVKEDMLVDGNSNQIEDSIVASLEASPINEDFFLSHRHAASPERPSHDSALSTAANIHLQLAECGSPENCNVGDDSESLPLEELFSKILEIKKQRDKAEVSDRSSSPSRSTRTAPFGVEPEKNFAKDASGLEPPGSSSNDHLRSNHGSGFRSLLRKIKKLFHIPFRKSSKRKKSSTMETEDKQNTRLPSVGGQNTLESEGRASVSFLVDGGRISSSFSIPLSNNHNHERESQKFPFPFGPPFALSDLEPAVLANYLTALDSASARDSPYIDLISPLSFDTRAAGDIDFGGDKTKERAKSGPQIQKHRTLKDIKRTHSFSALPPESIQGAPYTYRPQGSSFSSMDLGNWRTGRARCWKSQMSDQFFSQDENEPLLTQQNTPRHLRTKSQFSITFGVKRVKSNGSKKSKQSDEESGRSDVSDSGTVEEVVHGFEESKFTTFPVASTFVFDGLVVPVSDTKETPRSMLAVL